MIQGDANNLMHTASKVIEIHAQAPLKPAAGASCNGCGVCCVAELCPLAQVRYQRRTGPCPALRWSAENKRYTCGMLENARYAWVRWWIHRSIAAGIGCDSFVVVDEIKNQ